MIIPFKRVARESDFRASQIETSKQHEALIDKLWVTHWRLCDDLADLKKKSIPKSIKLIEAIIDNLNQAMFHYNLMVQYGDKQKQCYNIIASEIAYEQQRILFIRDELLTPPPSGDMVPLPGQRLSVPGFFLLKKENPAWGGAQNLINA